MNLLSETKSVLISAAAAAGTTLITGNTIDMLGFKGLHVTCLMGDNADTAVPHLQVFHGDLADGSDAVLLAGTTAQAAAGAADQDNKYLIVDVEHPMKRYVTFKLVRGTADVVLEGITAIKYKARDIPVTQGSDVLRATGLYNPDPA
jgi:hypothetical protein